MTILIFLYKPFYTLSFFCLFCFEYFYFFRYLYTILINNSRYLVFKISDEGISESSVMGIWTRYCEMLAFKRIYILLSKKKRISIRVIMWLIIYFLGIPIKILRIIFFIFKSKKGFKDGVLEIYYKVYFKINKLKIEVLEGEFYLNCSTLGKLIVKINPSMLNENKIFELINELKLLSIKYNKYEMNDEPIKMMRMGFKTQEGNIIIPHYGYFEKNIIHATSNVKITLTSTQKIALPFPNLIKEGAKSPGSIITDAPLEVYSDDKFKMISKEELSSVVYDHLDKFDLPKENYKYISDKDYSFRYVFQMYNKNINENLISELRCNFYSEALINADNEDILGAIEEWKIMSPIIKGNDIF